MILRLLELFITPLLKAPSNLIKLNRLVWRYLMEVLPIEKSSIARPKPKFCILVRRSINFSLICSAACSVISITTFLQYAGYSSFNCCKNCSKSSDWIVPPVALTDIFAFSPNTLYRRSISWNTAWNTLFSNASNLSDSSASFTINGG